MKRQFKILTGTAFLVAALLSTSLAARSEHEGAGPVVPLDSLVLVLNLISSTHARPATGVVVAGGENADRSLVLVPANFVGAGDEIIVLDGGNDILRNGRSTRTVVRSAEAGVALLEVEGLARPGVALSTEAWPLSAETSYGFAAWPAADALVEGASIIRRTIRTDDALPEVAGPLFDQCGNLAAIYADTEQDRVTGSLEVAAILNAFGVEYVSAACSGQPLIAEHTDSAESPELHEANVSDAANHAVGGAETTSPPTETVSTLGLTPSQKTGLLIAWIVLVVLAFGHYVRRQNRRKATHLVLERRTESGQRFHHPIKLDPDHQSARFERNGVTLDLKMTGNGLETSVPEDENLTRVALVIDGTPCLGGERILIGGEQEIRIGGETFQLPADPEHP